MITQISQKTHTAAEKQQHRDTAGTGRGRQGRVKWCLTVGSASIESPAAVGQRVHTNLYFHKLMEAHSNQSLCIPCDHEISRE